jgi:hypothetical protein
MSSRRTESTSYPGTRRVTTVYDEDPASITTAEQDVAAVEESRAVSADPWDVGRGMARTVSLVLLTLLVVVEVGLGFRLAFLALGANPANGFVDFIYDSTGWLVEPFDGILSDRTTNDGVFEAATVIAMVVYAVAVGLVVMLISAATSMPSPMAKRSSATRTEYHDRIEHGH